MEYDKREININYDRILFSGPLMDLNQDIYVFNRADSQIWLMAKDDHEFECYRVKQDGTIDESQVFKFQKVN